MHPVALRVGTVALGAVVQETVHADVARPRLEMQQRVTGAFEGGRGTRPWPSAIVTTTIAAAVVTLQEGPAEELLDRAAAGVGSRTRALLDAQGVRLYAGIPVRARGETELSVKFD